MTSTSVDPVLDGKAPATRTSGAGTKRSVYKSSTRGAAQEVAQLRRDVGGSEGKQHHGGVDVDRRPRWGGPQSQQ